MRTIILTLLMSGLVLVPAGCATGFRAGGPHGGGISAGAAVGPASAPGYAPPSGYLPPTPEPPLR